MNGYLIIDRNPNLCADICNFFRSSGHTAELALDFAGAVQMVEEHDFEIIISDVKIPGGNISDLVKIVKEKSPDTIVIVASEIDTVQEGVRAVKEGSFGILQKPFNIPELNFQIKKAIEEKNKLLQELTEPEDRYKNIYQPYSFVGESPKIKEVFNIVTRVAKTNSSVIITGETGTGKELVAGAIHYNSDRADGPFVRVNCAALPEQLLESELFGYEKGAFTGAERLRIGRFEQANKGSIFLDEVADMSLFTQAKVLRVIQEKEFERLGSSETVKTDVRIISATNKDLLELMEKGLFRTDLYYRLNVISIHLPPLRERDGDLRLLVQFFLKKITGELNRKISRVEPAAVKMLSSYHWPGNIRELENTLERAVLMADGDSITTHDLKLFFAKNNQPQQIRQIGLPEDGINLEAAEKDFIMQALKRTNWVQKDAAKLLGINSRVLNYKIKRYEITHPRWKQNK